MNKKLLKQYARKLDDLSHKIDYLEQSKMMENRFLCSEYKKEYKLFRNKYFGLNNI